MGESSERIPASTPVSAKQVLMQLKGQSTCFAPTGIEAGTLLDRSIDWLSLHTRELQGQH
jgi:hypothetical protein